METLEIVLVTLPALIAGFIAASGFYIVNHARKSIAGLIGQNVEIDRLKILSAVMEHENHASSICRSGRS
jgi:hypothetical protein